MGNKSISVDSLLSGSVSDTDESVLYEEKIDLGKLHDTVFKFYDNAMSMMNNSKEKISNIENEFAKINNSQKFYYGGDAAHQHGNLNIANQHFDDLQKVSPIFTDPAAITRMAENYNEALVKKKHIVRINLCQKKLNEIYGKEVERKTRDVYGNHHDKEVKDGLYKENWHYELDANEDGGLKYKENYVKRIWIEAIVGEGNVIDIENKIIKVSESFPNVCGSFPYDRERIVDYYN